MENEKGERFFVSHETCKSIVYSEQAAGFSHLQTRYINLGIQHARVDFLTKLYTAEDVTAIFEWVSRRQHIPQTHSVNMEGCLL